MQTFFGSGWGLGVDGVGCRNGSGATVPGFGAFVGSPGFGASVDTPGIGAGVIMPGIGDGLKMLGVGAGVMFGAGVGTTFGQNGFLQHWSLGS